MALPAPVSGIRLCVFDAYGTLFDVHSAVARERDAIGPRADEMSAIWRAKQLEYSWLRSLMGAHRDFLAVTRDALDHAAEAIGLENADLLGRLMQAYRRLDAYPEVPAVLASLRKAGMKTAILSNGEPGMLADAVSSAGIADLIDAVLSVEEAGIYKPAAPVYDLVGRHFPGIGKPETCFLSSNGWDAHGAAHYGFQVFWVNRFDRPLERLPGTMRGILRDLQPLPGLVRP